MKVASFYGARASLLLLPVSLIFLIGISGCKIQPRLVTVFGTVSAPNWSGSITSNPIVTVSNGNQSYSAIVPVTGSLGSEIITYSIPWVPTGKYSVTITIFASYTGTGATYSVNGGTSAPVTSENTSTSGPPYTYTVEIDDVDISADTRVDLQLPPVG